jgi:hypothetical protein
MLTVPRPLKTGLLVTLTFAFAQVRAQEMIYDNFEGSKLLHYGERSGVLDTNVKNPAPNTVNKSERCAMYVRNGARKFANIKMNLDRKLAGVESYATYEGLPPRLKLKVYTSAPPGTLVEILLGNRNGNNDYPAGTHSQYQAYTAVSNEWEELEFKFAQVPQGSETAANNIDQAVLLFNPNSSTSDTYYFDDLTGPGLMAEAAPEAGKKGDKSAPKEKGKPKGKSKAKNNKTVSDKTATSAG